MNSLQRCKSCVLSNTTGFLYDRRRWLPGTVVGVRECVGTRRAMMPGGIARQSKIPVAGEEIVLFATSIRVGMAGAVPVGVQF
jgi:hypothetical protein